MLNFAHLSLLVPWIALLILLGGSRIRKKEVGGGTVFYHKVFFYDLNLNTEEGTKCRIQMWNNNEYLKKHLLSTMNYHFTVPIFFELNQIQNQELKYCLTIITAKCKCI